MANHEPAKDRGLYDVSLYVDRLRLRQQNHGSALTESVRGGRELQFGSQHYCWPPADAGRLRQLIGSGNCIAFVGSGPSTGAGYPDWKKLISDLCTACNVKGFGPSDALSANRLMRLAEKCRQADEAKYCDVLLRHFAHVPHDVPEPLQRLAQLPFKSYVTTVFDPLLERALQTQSNSTSLATYRYPSLPIEFVARHLFYIHGQIQVVRIN